MKNLILAVLTLAALASAACHERKAAPQPRPDYDGVRNSSESSQKSLDKEAGSY